MGAGKGSSRDSMMEQKAETGQQSPRHARMATLCLTMASRETKSAIPWETWQRVNHAREFIVG